MAIGTGAGRSGRASINVTPLIDVLLVLLIIFMVIQPSVVHGLSAVAPNAPDKRSGEPDPHTVVIEVGGDPSSPTYTCNEKPEMLAQLGVDLRKMVLTGGQRPIFVRGASGLDYGTSARVMDTAHAAGIEQIGLLTSQNVASSAIPR